MATAAQGKTWDVKTVGLNIDPATIWGIQPEYLPAILDLMRTEKISPAHAAQSNLLPFPWFRAFVEYLHSHNYNTNDLQAAITKWVQDHAPAVEQPTAKQPAAIKLDQHDIDRQLQQQMRRLFSPQSPTLITVDGNWGPKSEKLLQQIIATYRLKPLPRDQSLVNVLTAIANHIARIYTHDEKLLAAIEDPNPMLIIDNSTDRLELRARGQDAVLIDTTTNREIVHFESFADNHSGSAFLSFSYWLAMLTMEAGPASPSGIFSKDFQTPGPDDEFMFRPQYIQEGSSIEFSYSHSAPLKAYAVYFTGSETHMAIIKADSASGAFNATITLPDTDYLNINQDGIELRYKADYCRIFIFREDFAGSSNMDEIVYEDILAATAEDILDTCLIGLRLKPTISSIPSKNKWIFVTGTPDNKLDPAMEDLSRELGVVLATNGYSLITGNGQGVDFVASHAFALALQNQGDDDHLRLQMVLQPKQSTRHTYGTKINVDDNDQWLHYCVNEAAAIVIIGDAGEISDLLSYARESNVPFIQVPETTVAELIPTLDQLSSKHLSEEDFRQKATDRYTTRKSTLPKPSAKNNFKELKAKVSRSKTPGSYPVELIVESINPLAEERVAFFIDLASDPIQYTEMSEGTASLSIEAEEAFQLGAYIEDGTMLELDLNEVKGLPKDFYYKPASQKFIKKVEEVYQQRPSRVADDTQKNRWGGNPVNGDRRLTATVTPATIPGLFTVNIELIADKTPLKGEVAFFLDKSFGKEIEYRRAKGSKATLSITVTAPFTIGAYTEDGTMLELDLTGDFPTLEVA